MRSTTVAFLILSFCILDKPLFCQDFNYAESWLKLSEDTRLYWVWGFTEGQNAILEEVKPKPQKTLTADVTDYDARVVSRIMTEVYKDPSNSYIPWKYMTRIAKMKLKGATTVEVDKELSLLREYAEWAKQQNRKHEKDN